MIVQEVRMPFRPSMMKVRRQAAKWIILHHTAELYDIPSARIDNGNFQLPDILTGVQEKKQADVNYHYIIEKVKDDYQIFVCRPFIYLCEWPDIHDDINKRAIHVALLGSYDFKIPPKRLYEALAYRLLNPFMKIYALTPSRIKGHNEVSSNKELSCPGEFLNMAIVESMVRKFVIR